MTGLDQFSEATREWFRASFGSPTDAQEGAWHAVAQGKNALVIAPTGSGKTLSAFLWSIDRLFSCPPEAAKTTVLYISPLKALGVDIERNLRSPLVGIGHTVRRFAGERGHTDDAGSLPEPPHISVGVRTGDTSAKQRRDLVRTPPHILITTPESLYLMLTSQARETLAEVETVIVDEVHALAGTKRGAHLAVSLERLDSMLRDAGNPTAQRIGLSATVEPRDEVARFLGGRQPVEVVAPESQKEWDITVSVPVEDLASPTAVAGPIEPSGDPELAQRSPEAIEGPDTEGVQPSIWPHVEHKVVDLVAQRRSTIVFVNSRRLAEKLTGRLNEIWAEKTGSAAEPDAAHAGEADPAEPAELARAHHGSVSKEQRALIEEDLKSGRLRCVVATSSLELGIDMGAVDLVVQVEAPHAVSAGLQRIGRAGHQVGEVSVGWFFPKHRGDLVSTAVVVERMLSGHIEALHIPKNPLDILAQQTIAASALECLDVEEWFETLRRSAPFASLPRSAYESVLDLLAGKYPSDRFADLRPRIIWDRDAGTLSGRPGAQRLAVTSGGTIPDRGLFGVYLVGSEESGEGTGAVSGSARTGGRRVGELDEEMVYESRVGDVFALGTSSWRIEEITFDRVLVSPAFGQPASLPFWRGDGLGRPAELGRALGAFVREVHAGGQEEAVQQRLQRLGMDQWARENLVRYLADQQEATGALPTDRRLVVERTRDELGDWRIILHSPYGLQVHAPWALAVGERLHERYGLDGAAMASDDGIVLRVPMMDEEPPGAELFRFEPEELEELVTSQVSASALFSGRFREASARALLLPRQNPGQRTPLWQQRQRSSQLLEVAAGYPDFPMIMEAMREVLQDVYDMDALLELTRGISQRQITLVEATTHRPSPFAQSILFGYIAQYLYEGDSPLAERRAAALSVDPELLGELLGRVELREFLDQQIIDEAEAHVQRLSPARRLPTSPGARGEDRAAESVADLLRLLGPLTSEQLAQRLESPHSPAHEAEAEEIDGGEAGSQEADGQAADAEAAAHASVPEAEAWAEQLVSSQRAFRVSWQGQPAYAAVEDAARLRDGLGVPLPPGIPQTFLDPVADPLGDLVGRFARTHGPFTIGAAARALGLGRAVVADALRRLTEEHRVVEGLFRPEGLPAGEETEWCEVEMLRRIRRRSLAALRAEVEPVPVRAYAQFLLQWQGVAEADDDAGSADLRAADLSAVLSQLSGAAAPASAWESFILPARLPDYRPGMLDELLASGEVVALGRGALTGHDGWVAFAPREDAETLLRPAPAQGEEEGSLRQAVVETLGRGGAWFADALHDQLVRDGVSTSAQQTADALWELFWEGRVIPDSFAPVRSFLASGSTAHRQKPRPSRSRHASRRMALRQSVQAHRGRLGAEASSTGAEVGVGGRWSLPPAAETAPTVASHTQAEILLDRYGVVTRGSVISEQRTGRSPKEAAGEGPLAGGFAAVYKVLAAAEEAGQIRRGHFIEQLGAAQFTSSATIDQLRAISERLEDASGEQRSAGNGSRGARTRGQEESAAPIALAATDPANAYGAALDWPAVPGAEEPGSGVSARPGRKAGAVVVLCRGELVIYMERGGRTLLLFTEDEELLDAAAVALTARLRAAKVGRIAVERVNGQRILEHRFAKSLRAAGFHSSPSGLRFAG
ncbi:DEAD/DEAH box helicase [Nesterenkonia lacusekhoensis]|uniref:ATP-dependent Lhr-like helicase n=1 Tax=Nesterenkonia lacusekhoensis TaxID=150832 RepID=A0ABS4SYM5_9MICC|nr:ATP-dependent Lhr-like helicase [Nesterenkonia lacusekhoensis]